MFITSWYPTRADPVTGIFVKRHVEAVSRFCDVAVLSVVGYENLERGYEIEYSQENDVPTVRVYYRETKFWKQFKIANFLRFMSASYFGSKVMREKFGVPHLVHAIVVIPAGILALILKYLKGIPYIVTEHWSGYLPADGGYKSKDVFTKLLTRVITANAKAVTTVSNTLAKAMSSHGLKKQYYVVPNVVDMRLFCPLADRQDCKRTRILYVSRLSDRQKNVSGILRAIASVLLRRQDFELHIVGDGTDRALLEDVADNMRVKNRFVFFHGLKSPQEIVEFMQTADFLL